MHKTEDIPQKGKKGNFYTPLGGGGGGLKAYRSLFHFFQKTNFQNPQKALCL